MRSARTRDLLVVGGGTAGLVAAHTAALLGARVTLVERGRLGGDCLWTGCVPSKALLAAAHSAAQARSAARFGVHVDGVRVDTRAVLAHVRSAIATIEPADDAASLQRAGVEVLLGNAVLTGPGRAAVDGRDVPWRRLLLATGSRPAVPDLPGLSDRSQEPGAPHLLTSDTVWDLETLPDRVVVLGGGAIGCELGQAMARLGSTVTLVEPLPRLLAREDPDASALVHAALAADGVEVLTGWTATAAGTGAITLRAAGRDGQGRTVPCDAVLVATGRRPRTQGLGLAEGGVEVDDRGYLRVDARLRTTAPHVWAAGDVTGHPAFTHVAGIHASIAASNAVLGLRRTVDLSAVPRVTYTDPEVAAVGAPTWAEEGADDGPAPRTVTRGHDHVDRAIAEGRTEGFARLALGPRGRITGATVVGPRAGETLAELTLAVRTGLRTADLAGTTHPYPTYGDGPWNAALDDVRARLGGAGVRAVTRAAVLARRLPPLRSKPAGGR